jgi:hypothetical protein
MGCEAVAGLTRRSGLLLDETTARCMRARRNSGATRSASGVESTSAPKAVPRLTRYVLRSTRV